MSKVLNLKKELHLVLSSLKCSLFFCCLFSLGQLQAQQDFSITVTDEESEPLIGVEVYTADYSYGSVTNERGVVTIQEKYLDEDITFSYLGFEEQTVMARLIINRGGVVIMESKSEIIEEIILLGRNELNPDALPYSIAAIGQEEIASTNPQTSADALAHHGSVYVQKSQMGGGSPVLRGFEANKVLLVVDGVRMNNAIYRNGHLQNAITVDQAMLDEMQVIFGPNALIYGSDALGGVIHFKSRLPQLNYNKNQSALTETKYYARYSSANMERSGHVDFNIGKEKIASLTSLTFSSFGDLRSGDNRPSAYPDFGKREQYIRRENGEDIRVTNDDFNVQVGTAYSQFDLLQKVLFQASDDLQFVYNFQFSTSSNVPRYDMLTETTDGENLRWAEWDYGPQTRLFSSITSKHIKQTKLYDKAIAILAFQKIQEDRITRRVDRTDRENNNEDVSVINLTLDFHKGKPENTHKLYYGVDYNYNKVNSTAFVEDVETGIISSDIFTRYPSAGSSMSTMGAYAQYHLSNESQMRHLSLGARYTANFLDLRYSADDPIAWPQELVDGIKSDNSALVGSIGYVHNTDNGWQLSLLGSTAFRTPNIDDMAKIRVRGDEVLFPNTTLTPEKSLNGEITLAKSIVDSRGKERLKLSATYFSTRLTDAILRESFTQPNGSNILVSGVDTFNIVANVNASKATVHGVSANIFYQVSDDLNVRSSWNWTKGRVTEPTERPLSHIPPVYGNLSLNYEKDVWGVRYVSRYNGKKLLIDYGDSSDNPEFATPEGALAWHTMNVYGNYKLTEGIELSVGLENILDTHYRQFASGISAAGRNAIVTLRGKF